MKRDSSRAVWVVVFVAGAFVALGGLRGFFGGGKEVVAWRGDLEEGKKEAAAQGKPVFLYFTAGWCGPCQQMKRTTWADQKVADALEAGYVPVRVDIDQRAGLAQEYRVESIPWFSVLDDHGRAVKAYSGAVSPAEFLEWLGRGGKG